jgi:hypothetical protein
LTLSAVTLFEPIREQDYIGYNDGIGSRGMDESVLDGYAIADDAPAPTQHENGESACIKTSKTAKTNRDCGIAAIAASNSPPAADQRIPVVRAPGLDHARSGLPKIVTATKKDLAPLRT